MPLACDLSPSCCAAQADSAFWASHGMSMGVEGEDGQAQEFAGALRRPAF